jgi:probable HAF family extracellular repeat protein
MFSLRATNLAIASLFLAALPAPAQVMYTVTDLGLPNNGMFPFSTAGATGINNAGQVTGNAMSVSPFPPNRAFRYSPGVGMVDLGSLVANGTSNGAAINAAGQVVGLSQISGGGLRAFRYTDGAGMVNLGVLPGLTDSTAGGINDLGQVVGLSGLGVSWVRVFRYSDATGLVDLGLPTGQTGAVRATINNAGQISLTASSAGGAVFGAFRYSDATGYVSLGTLGGVNSTANAINVVGNVVGSSSTMSGAGHAFEYTNGTGMVDLGVLPGGTSSSATAINALDVIVGIGNSPAGSQRAFVYRAGLGMLDLNDLIGTGTGWTLNGASGINDLGQIVGNGTLNGAQRAFLLTPVPEPSSIMLLGAILCGLQFQRRRPI